MPLQELYYIAEMVVGLAVIISIVFVGLNFELRFKIRTLFENPWRIDASSGSLGYLRTQKAWDNFLRISKTSRVIL